MRWGQVILAGMILLGTAVAARGEKVFVSEDETVLQSPTFPNYYDAVNQHYWFKQSGLTPGYIASNPNNGSTVKSGLMSGMYWYDPSGTSLDTLILARFYLKFLLPSPRPDLVKATLWGNYVGDWSTADATHSFYHVPDAGDVWREKPSKTLADLQSDPTISSTDPSEGITWENQPGYSGPALGTFVPGSSGWYSWDITATVQGEYTGGNGILSLMFRSDSETIALANVNMEEFAEKDHLSENDYLQSCAFYLELEFVPEPSLQTAILGLVLMAAVYWVGRWRSARCPCASNSNLA